MSAGFAAWAGSEANAHVVMHDSVLSIKNEPSSSSIVAASSGDLKLKSEEPSQAQLFGGQYWSG